MQTPTIRIIETAPGENRRIVMQAIDAQPALIVEDDFETAVVVNGDAQGPSEPAQREPDPVIASRIDHFRKDTKCGAVKVHAEKRQVLVSSGKRSSMSRD